MDTSSEQFRRECEARYWLSRGYDNPGKVAELRAMIAEKRGTAAAERLIDDMRDARADAGIKVVPN